MNQTFNINRFWLLFKKTIVERPTQLIGLITLVLIITFVVFLLGVQAKQWNGAHAQSFTFGYISGGLLLSSMVFGQFGTNAGGASYLTLPASSFEKWLCGVLIVGVLFTLMFLGMYRIMDFAFVSTYHNGLDKTSPLYQELYDKAYILEFDSRIPDITYAYFVNLAGVMMLGTLYFNKAGFIKTALATAAFVALVYVLNSVVAHAMMPNIVNATPYNNVFMEINHNGNNINLPKPLANMISVIWRFLLPAILWLTAYISLKEKEI